uniref:SH3 domain-containing protein n=1 Tax=Pavo cristatus TaxID=9049 RepID=A0A8C9FTB8_PAVCR
MLSSFCFLFRQKALASTGGRSVQAACDWLFSHVGDPFLDDTLPREYVLYLRPTGPLAQKLSEFWQQSKQICGKNKAHNIFPHITLCQFFMCEDSKVDALTEALQATVMRWKCKFPAPLPLELYTSSNFIGLFVKEESAEVLKKFAADFAAEAASKADVHVEPHKKQLHVTLAYHFQTSHLPTLEKLAQNIDVKLGCDWVAAIFSRDIRFVNHETLQVIYPYTPQNDDELELVPGDFIFMSPVEQTSTSEGWIYGISLATGCSGLLPENYITKADECGTWVFHGYVKLLSPTLVTAKRELSSCDFTWHCLAARSRQCLQGADVAVQEGGNRCDAFHLSDLMTAANAPDLSLAGRYVRSNLNMPHSLPQRSGGFRDYEKDAPITVLGCMQARLVGELPPGRHELAQEALLSPSHAPRHRKRKQKAEKNESGPPHWQAPSCLMQVLQLKERQSINPRLWYNITATSSVSAEHLVLPWKMLLLPMSLRNAAVNAECGLSLTLTILKCDLQLTTPTYFQQPIWVHVCMAKTQSRLLPVFTHPHP